MFFIYLISIFIIVAVYAAFFFVFKSLHKKRLKDALGLKLLSVRLPKKEKSGEQQGDFKDEINLTAQLFGILTGLKSPFCFEAAVHHIGEEIHFYVAVPNESIDFVSRQIEGLWKDAQVEPAEDYNIFNPAGVNQGIYLKQKISYVLPLRSYVEANIDTFSPILSGLSKINEVGEGAGIQILVRPAAKSAKKSIFQNINNLKKGVKLEDISKGVGFKLKDVKSALAPEDKEKKTENKVIDDEAIKALEMKISKPLLEASVRIMVSAPSQYQADMVLESISGGYSQFSAPRRQELRLVKPRDSKKLAYQFAFREFDDSQTMILNIEELASIFHFPASTTDIPRLKWVKSKEAQPPAELPKSGTLIGESFFRSQKKPVYITEDDRRRHVYVIGQTGTGKSTLMTNMVIEDIEAGKGVAVIDPHGPLIDQILTQIPKNRINDVVLFDPGDIQKPFGMNMLDYDFSRPEQKTFIVDEMQSIFNRLFPESGEAMGPVFQQYMRNTLLLLMEDAPNEPATLIEVARVLTDSEFRNKKLARIKNPVVLDFWEKEVANVKGEGSLANMAPYITSKFNNFIANDYVRPIIGQTKSAFNFRQLMDEGKILLVNLSKGKIGDLNANLLGMIVVGKILMAALSRVDIADEKKRRDFNLYIDEFQNFTTDSIATILSEARKYRLNLTIAHQFIAQLTEKIRDAVFGNVGSIVAFRVGAQDAEFLIKQFEPVFSENDLINIDNFNAYAKILVSGATTKPFNIKTLPPEKGDQAMAEKIKELSRVKYGRDRQEVEEEILKRLRA
ncbi:MAG: type IV secretory system conjugative DNA transfer family protein [Patescibacteria group bacterium]|nr:type IV secretory system conjugative DNA transfer family protein [Patescibacteria group bacterium]